MHEEISEGRQVEGPEGEDGAEGQDPRERKAPMKPSPEEVARHNLTHIPRRMWCKICAEADLQEDPHKRSKIDHKGDGIPEIHMDYKELHKGKRPFLILRERATGGTFGLRCSHKGPSDEWAVKRCAEKIEQWGFERVRLVVRSDGEPAIKAMREAIKHARKGETAFGTSPPRDPQSNGVAERAVKEFMGQMRKLKLGLESRLRTTIPNDHALIDWIAQHAGLLIAKYLRGSPDGFTAHYRMFGKDYNGDLAEFGECVWAKPKRVQATGGSTWSAGSARNLAGCSRRDGREFGCSAEATYPRDQSQNNCEKAT